MFGDLGLHIIKFPSGRYGFVGSIPVALGVEIPAAQSAVMGCRAHRNAKGELVTWRFPSFETAEEARAFAASRGWEARA